MIIDALILALNLSKNEGIVGSVLVAILLLLVR